MSSTWLKPWTRVLAMALVMALFAIVDTYAEKEILFPEIAALALGFWIMDKSPWRGGWLAIWASPTLAALTGVLLLRYAHLPIIFLVGSAFILVVLQLKLLRSEVFPAISAAILAIITHSTSWLYPVSVGFLMAIIVLGKFFLEKFGTRIPVPISQNPHDLAANNEGLLPECIYWGKIIIGVLFVSTLALHSSFLFMIAPPLIVAFVELSRPEQPLRRTPVKVILMLFCAACVGVLWYYCIANALHGPLWLFAGLSLGTIFCLFHFLKASFPPVAAIALLPALVPNVHFWVYPFHVLVGSTLFISMGIFCFRPNRAEPILPWRA